MRKQTKSARSSTVEMYIISGLWRGIGDFLDSLYLQLMSNMFSVVADESKNITLKTIFDNLHC